MTRTQAPMLLLSPKLFTIARYVDDRGVVSGGHYGHWCPGCADDHDIAVDRPFHNNAIWRFNRDVGKPTFEPSINIRVGPYPDASKKAGQIEVCHYFLRSGSIQFLSDCTHALRGQTVPLPDLPSEVLLRIKESQVWADWSESMAADEVARLLALPASC